MIYALTGRKLKRTICSDLWPYAVSNGHVWSTLNKRYDSSKPLRPLT